MIASRQFSSVTPSFCSPASVRMNPGAKAITVKWICLIGVVEDENGSACFHTQFANRYDQLICVACFIFFFAGVDAKFVPSVDHDEFVVHESLDEMVNHVNGHVIFRIFDLLLVASLVDLK